MTKKEKPEYCCAFAEDMNERRWKERRYKNGWRKIWCCDQWGYLWDHMVKNDICPFCDDAPNQIGYNGGKLEKTPCR